MNVHSIARMSGGSAYLWMAARARNALRRVVVFGIVGGVVFISALIAFVLVPRNASRKALAVAARIEARTDSAPTVAARDRYLAEFNLTDSVLNATRRALMPIPAAVIDTFPPAVRAQRDSLSAELATLNRLIDRAENAPLPTSYRALAASPTVAADPRVRVLLDSLADIERERNAFGAVGGVDPVYLSLTSRATAIGRQIQGIADAKRGEVRGKLALIRPTPAPVVKPVITVDTTQLLAQRATAQQNYAAAVKQLEVVVERSRRQADVEAPPLIDVVSESYRTLYLHIASVEASVPIVTITGDDPGIVATVAANLAASAAYEARSTLLVDVDPTTCSVASVLRIRPDPGLSGIITGNATWPEAIVPTTIGRDRPLDVLPSGTRRSGLPETNVVEEVRRELARMQRR